MLRLTIITLCVLTTYIDMTVKGYTIGGRSRDYTGSYSSSGFVGLSKDANSDLADQLTTNNGGYAAASSHRYSSVPGGGHASPGSSYSSAGYVDNGQSSGFGSHSSSSPEALNSISSSYANDAHTTSDVSPGYSTGSSSAETYSSGSSHGSAGFAGYSGTQSTSGLSSNDHSAVEYASPSSSSYPAASSSLNNFAAGGPKAAAYTASGAGHVHATSPYASGPSMSFLSGAHPSSFPGSSHSSAYSGSHLSSYPGGRPSSSSYPGSAHSSHSSFPEGLRFSGASGASLSNYLSGHSSGGPSSFVHSNGAPSSHRGIPSFLLGASSNPSPTFAKGPSPFYSGAYPKSGNKYIIIKDGPGGHAALMHPGEPSFPSRMFAGGASGYKVRSAGPFSSGPHLGSSNFVSSHSSGYPGSGGHHGGGPGGPYFGYQ